MYYLKNYLTDEIKEFRVMKDVAKYLRVSNTTVARYVNEYGDRTLYNYIYSVRKGDSNFRNMIDPIRAGKDSVFLYKRRDSNEVLVFNNLMNLGRFLTCGADRIILLLDSLKEDKTYTIYRYKDFMKLYPYIKWQDLIKHIHTNGTHTVTVRGHKENNYLVPKLWLVKYTFNTLSKVYTEVVRAYNSKDALRISKEIDNVSSVVWDVPLNVTCELLQTKGEIGVV